jgi:glycosyltransferase involved in cell wall biosynthesis
MSVSVVIPAYNEEKYLARTLESIKEQDIKCEVLVICNGCKDKSFEIAMKYADKVFNLKERNVSKAKNYGADKAKFGKLVFLDADVVLGEGVLSAVREVLEKGRFFGTVKGRGGGIKNGAYLKFKNGVNKYKPWSQGFVYCDKKSFFEMGGFDEKLKRGELRDFFRKVKGKYKRLNVYVEPSERRVETWGISKLVKYWLFEKEKEEYEAIR